MKEDIVPITKRINFVWDKTPTTHNTNEPFLILLKLNVFVEDQIVQHVLDGNSQKYHLFCRQFLRNFLNIEKVLLFMLL